MSVKALGEIRTIRVQQKQKNGDIYVIERKIRYDLEKKYNVVQSSKVIGKIVKVKLNECKGFYYFGEMI